MTKDERRAMHRERMEGMSREQLLRTGIKMMLRGIAEAKVRADSAHRALAHLGRPPMKVGAVEEEDVVLRDCADRLSAIYCEIREEYDAAEEALLSGDRPCRKEIETAFTDGYDRARPEVVHRYFEPNRLEHVNFVRDGAA